MSELIKLQDIDDFAALSVRKSNIGVGLVEIEIYGDGFATVITVDKRALISAIRQLDDKLEAGDE